MPRLTDDLEQHKPALGNYGFSAVRLEDLGATEYTLVTVAVDSSLSVGGFVADLEKCIQSIVNSCKLSPRADNLQLRLVEFNSRVGEIHGFKLLESCNLNDYVNIINPRGTTALYDATENAVTSTAVLGEKLTKNDFDANGIVFVITDGEENNSAIGLSSVVESFQNVAKKECLESLVSILIGVNITDTYVAQALQSFNDDAGFDKYVELDNADPKTLAKLAEFVSKSISSQSQSLGTGGPSKDIQSLTI
jgi:uncharacterized protein YegL